MLDALRPECHSRSQRVASSSSEAETRAMLKTLMEVVEEPYWAWKPEPVIKAKNGI